MTLEALIDDLLQLRRRGLHALPVVIKHPDLNDEDKPLEYVEVKYASLVGAEIELGVA